MIINTQTIKKNKPKPSFWQKKYESTLLAVFSLMFAQVLRNPIDTRDGRIRGFEVVRMLKRVAYAGQCGLGL